MKKLYTLLVFCLLAITSQAQILWHDSVTFQSPKVGGGFSAVKLRYWYKGGASVAQGNLLVNGYESGWAITGDSAIKNAVKATNFALILLTTADTNLATGIDPTIHQSDSLFAGLAKLGAKVGHPELANNPNIVFGWGKGAAMAIQAAYLVPTQFAGIISYHPFTVAGKPSWATTDLKTVPHLVISGETEGPDLSGNNGGPFTDTTVRLEVLARRANNELIQHAIEMNGSYKSWTPGVAQYISYFIKRTAALRIPAGSNATAAPITLNTLAESSGWLGKSVLNHSFKAANYTVAAFSASSAAGSSWFYDQAAANKWKNFHVSLFTITLPPISLATPYCSGVLHQSALTLRYRTPSGFTFNQGNEFRVEVSNIYGDFANADLPARNCYTVLKSQATDTTTGFEFLYPDNLYIDPTIPAGTKPRYRIRLVSSNPWMQSASTGELKLSQICDSANIALYPFDGGKYWFEAGETITVKAKLKPGFSVSSGNRFSLYLSDSSFDFISTPPTLIGDTAISSVAAGSTITLRGKIPANTPVGYRYMVKVKSSNPLDSSTTTGIAFKVKPRPVPQGLVYDLPRNADFRIYPNPGNGICNLAFQTGNIDQTDLQIFDISGKSVYEGKIALTENIASVDLSFLKSGLYLVVGKTAKGNYYSKYLKN